MARKQSEGTLAKLSIKASITLRAVKQRNPENHVQDIYVKGGL